VKGRTKKPNEKVGGEREKLREQGLSKIGSGGLTESCPSTTPRGEMVSALGEGKT